MKRIGLVTCAMVVTALSASLLLAQEPQAPQPPSQPQQPAVAPQPDVTRMPAIAPLPDVPPQPAAPSQADAARLPAIAPLPDVPPQPTSPQQPTPKPDQPQQPRAPRGPRDPLHDAMFPPEMIMQHQRELGLTDEQKTFMRAEINKTTTRFNELQWQLQDAMEALHATMKDSVVNEQLALSQLDKVLENEREIKRLHMELAIRIKNKLTPEQQTKLQGIRRGPGFGGPGHGPGHGPGGGPGVAPRQPRPGGPGAGPGGPPTPRPNEFEI